MFLSQHTGLQISDLDIEDQYDFLSLYKGRQDSGDLVNTFTGNTGAPISVIIPSWLVTVTFKSDATIGGNGFTLKWEEGNVCFLSSIDGK